MYIPGRRRTGSRPSKTVMSLAVYAASAIKKALQMCLLRAVGSVSETAVGSCSRKARASGSRDELAELRILDLGGRGVGLGGRLGRRRDGGRHDLSALHRRPCFRHGPDTETELPRRRFAQRRGEPGGDLRGK